MPETALRLGLVVGVVLDALDVRIRELERADSDGDDARRARDLENTRIVRRVFAGVLETQAQRHLVGAALEIWGGELDSWSTILLGAANVIEHLHFTPAEFEAACEQLRAMINNARAQAVGPRHAN